MIRWIGEIATIGARSVSTADAMFAREARPIGPQDVTATSKGRVSPPARAPQLEAGFFIAREFIMPAKSEKQRRAAGAALAAKRSGRQPKGQASKQMAKMPTASLRKFAK